MGDRKARRRALWPVLATALVALAWAPPAGAVDRVTFGTDRGSTNGNYEIWAINVDGSGLTQITHDTDDDAAADTSLDGKRIVYMRSPNGDGPYDLFTMNPDGTNSHQLTASQGSNLFPVWSPDGRKIAFWTTRNVAAASPLDQVVGPPPPNYEVYTMNPDGTGQTDVSNNSDIDVDPSWSPDSRQIYFGSARGGNSEIWRMNADGTEQENLTHTPSASEIDPFVSPDGTKIAYTLARSGGADLGVMNSDGSGQRILLPDSKIEWTPSWSPDASRIYFAQSVGGGPRDLFSIRADGSGLTQITSTTFDEADPQPVPVPGSGARGGAAGGRGSDHTLPAAGQIGLTVSPRRVRAGRRVTFHFVASTIVQGRLVRLRGARIRFAGRRALTDANGRARMRRRLSKPRRYVARATKTGLRPGRATVTVRRGR